MMRQNNRFDMLWQGYLTNTLNTEEVQELFTLISKGDQFSEEHLDQLLNNADIREIEDQEGDFIYAALRARIQDNFKPVRRISLQRRGWVKYAAAFILLIGASVFYYTRTHQTATSKETIVQKQQPDIAPGGQKAVLTLADGSTITLDNASNGAIATQGNTSIEKLQDGQIAYKPNGATQKEVMINTMTTPKGGQYQLTLPDGTKVWLNAASSISYPVAFVGNERKVKITGEAYFEVAKDRQKPFRLNIREDVSVEVLGTHFNVNAYTNEPAIRTTLLEGSVNMIKGVAMERLRPGEQALVGEKILKTSNINVDQVMAWKSGLFDLTGSDFPTFMRQIERWYDIKIVYSGQVPDIEFQGKLNRAVPLSDIIKYLESLKVKCRLEERTLFVQAS